MAEESGADRGAHKQFKILSHTVKEVGEMLPRVSRTKKQEWMMDEIPDLMQKHRLAKGRFCCC